MHRGKPTFSPSLMCLDLLNANREIEILDRHADAYHVDIMDGHFAPNITLSPDFVSAVNKASDVPMDIHLMVTRPQDWITTLVSNGATWISMHAETINSNAFRMINLIESEGAKAGVVLNPATPISWVEAYLDRVDLVTLMTVDVGFAGQPFIEQVLPKIEKLAEVKAMQGLNFTIQIDGSCNGKTFKRLYDAGAERFILGNSGLWSLSPDLEDAFQLMFKDFSDATGYDF